MLSCGLLVMLFLRGLLHCPLIMKRSKNQKIARQRSQGAKNHVSVPIRIVGKNSGYFGLPSTITKTIHSNPQRRQNLLICSLMVFIVLFIPGQYASEDKKPKKQYLLNQPPSLYSISATYFEQKDNDSNQEQKISKAKNFLECLPYCRIYV